MRNKLFKPKWNWQKSGKLRAKHRADLLERQLDEQDTDHVSQ